MSVLQYELSNVNWIAVLVAAVAAFIFGGIWYAALFGKAWVKNHGFTEEEIKEMGSTPGKTYSLLFLTGVIMSLGMAILLNHISIGDVTTMTGMKLGGILWFAVALPIGFAGFVATWTKRKQFGAWIVDTGYDLCVLVLVGTILASWTG